MDALGRRLASGELARLSAPPAGSAQPAQRPARAVLDQVTVCATDPSDVIAFYDAALGALGLVRLVELEDEEDGGAVEAAAWGPPDGTSVLWVVTADAATSGMHVRLQAGNASDVEDFHRAALAAGGLPHSVPRRWTVYRRGEFGATVRDPLGNLVEVVAPE